MMRPASRATRALLLCECAQARCQPATCLALHASAVSTGRSVHSPGAAVAGIDGSERCRVAATRPSLAGALAALGSNGCTAARRLAEEPPARGSCAAQVAGLPGAEDGKWVDAATPAAACTIQRCTHLNHSMCVGESPPQTTLQVRVLEDKVGEDAVGLEALAATLL